MRSFLAADEPEFGAGVHLVVEFDGVVRGGGGAGVPVAGVSEGESRGDDLAQCSERGSGRGVVVRNVHA